MDVMGYRKEIIDLYNSEEYQRLKAYYSKRSMLDILGVARNELAHSNMIAWLLDPGETHGLGLFASKKLLHLLVMAKLDLRINSGDGRAVFDRELIDGILTNAYSVVGAEVKTEMAVDGNGNGRKDSRIDLFVELRLRCGSEGKILPVIIENKVESREHDNQTRTYYDWGMRYVYDKKGYLPPLFVFLSPEKISRLNRDMQDSTIPCACEKYIRVNYQYLVDNLLEPCLKQEISDDTRRVIEDYLRSLTYLYIKGDIKEGDNYMAISGEEKKLLAQFWDNNKNLLSAVLKAAAGDSDNGMTDLDRNDVEKAVAALAKRDMTKYRVEGIDGVFGKNGMVLAVVRKYKEGNPDITYEGLKAAFPDNLQGSFGVVMREDERRGNIDGPIRRYFNHEDEVIVLNDGTKMYVSTEWSKDNIDRFIVAAEKLGFKISRIIN